MKLTFQRFLESLEIPFVSVGTLLLISFSQRRLPSFPGKKMLVSDDVKKIRIRIHMPEESAT